MFETFKRLYERNQMTILNLKNGVKMGFITAEQFLLITGQNYE